MRVNVICRNWRDDRVLPRFARYLADGLGWLLTPSPVPADVHYLMGYFERQVCPAWPPGPAVASLFTHREEEEPKKTRLFDEVAGGVQLRVTMCRLYGELLKTHGPTIQPPLPLERDRFVIVDKRRNERPVVGLSGFTYKSKRKGEDLTAAVLGSKIGRSVEWRASGRGWPVPMKRYSWSEMPSFYQGLDVLVCPSRVEGGPMPVLEALACGVPVVIPRGVGILDEIPDAVGIHRYQRGNAPALVTALETALTMRNWPGREQLRAVTAPYTVEAWCAAHKAGFVRAFERAA